MSSSPGSFRPSPPTLGLLVGLAGSLAAVGFAVWRAALIQQKAVAHERDPELLERLLTAPGEEVSDGLVYSDRASARGAARAYREPCRWRGFRFHYRVEPVESGYTWSAWTDTDEEAETEDND